MDPALLYIWCFSLKHGDFKMPAVLQEAYTVGIDLDDLHSFDYGPLVGDHAVDHGDAF